MGTAAILKRDGDYLTIRVTLADGRTFDPIVVMPFEGEALTAALQEYADNYEAGMAE